jgi:hypothetical protein
MNSPTAILGLVLSILYGAAFHLLKGGNFWRLVFYLLLSTAGFIFGNYLAQILNFSLFQIGSLNLGFATIFSIFFLFLGFWLGLGGNKGNNPHPE